MNTEYILERLSFLGFDKETLSINDTSLYINKPINPRKFKDENKNVIELKGFRSLFVAHMYPENPSQEFYYLIYYSPARKKDYRKQYYYDYEHAKVFASGKTIEILMDNFLKELVSVDFY